MKKIIAIALCLIMMVGLAACGAESIKNTDWELSSVNVGGQDFDADIYGDWTISFEDTEFTMAFMGQEAEGTYEIDDDIIEMTANGDTIEAELEDGFLVIEIDVEIGETAVLTFEKA
ncbi:MAG: hypothetical protein E7546_07200 [Ruminococcaceae bacterium]|nr:hypothetical protein [Oscillospiraceae bacterium]